jgi:hypothetical protein
VSVPSEYVLYKISILKKSIGLLILSVAAAALLGHKGVATGLFFGGCVSILSFMRLYKYVLAIRETSGRQAKKFLAGRFLIIYLFAGITLFIALTKGPDVFLGAAAGLMLIRLCVFLDGLIFSEAKSAGG